MEPKAERDLELLQPGTYAKFKDFLAEMEELGDPMRAHETLRTEERQAYLYGTNKSKVTHSNHQDGVAADLHFVNAPNFPNTPERWQKAAEIAEKHGLECGGILWNGWDWNHFQDNGAPTFPLAP